MNAFAAASFFATLECELVDRSRWRTDAEARLTDFDYIQGFYNPRRRHSGPRLSAPLPTKRGGAWSLIHGNGTADPDLIAEQVDRARAVDGYHGQPVLFNEDDHFDFDTPWNNFVAAVSKHASWGYFDPGSGAGGAGARGDYANGYQLVPVNWGLSTNRKREFFSLVKEITGS